MAVGWPAGALASVLDCLSALPGPDRPVGMGGWLRRALHMLVLALRDNVPPRDYILHRLHEPGRQAWAADGLYGREPQWLSARLARLAGARWQDVQDKARFADLCRRHGLPCIPTLAIYRGGARVLPDVPFVPDQTGLWVKDLTGNRGMGAVCWRCDGGLYRDERRDMSVAPEALEALWRQRDCLVQPLLVAHPVLAALSMGAAIADFRVVSGIDPAGHVSIIAAQARLGAGGREPRWYILAAVEEGGRLRNPLLGGYLPLSHHPDTGADLTAVTVPFWSEVLELVMRAHGEVPEFARFPFLGWDVAITHEGPVLIETNAGWDGTYPQAGALPLGRTALPSIALAHLEKEQACG